ncbi:MAG TPA: hypothetical protein DEQ85_08550 [Clostridiales bacterium]|nr:hypothetical protein [Clostridiales bacterium]
MKITLICNCGLVFSSGETCLLIDALTQELAPFYRAPESVRQEIVTGTGAYEKTCGLLFTHLHPDHYDKEAAQAFSQYHLRAALYVPNRRELPPERLSIGSFTVELHRVRHTQVAGYGKSTVDAMIISAEGKSVYVASDSAPEVSLHESVLHGRRMDAAFWNGEMLLYKPEREALCRFAAQNFIYHIPGDPQDGFRRKLERLRGRYPAELETVRLLGDYPSEIIL